ncbi:hypothetical protein MKX01_035174 [Papaver californicum]|nr:hypothetical protein MKX01_035174 [Papaver californicum]
MCSQTLQNLSGVNVKITLWGSSCGDWYLRKKISRCCRKTPPPQIRTPAKRGNSTAALLLFDNRRTISGLLVAKWIPVVMRITNICAVQLPIGFDGWYYLGCSNCTTKSVGVHVHFLDTQKTHYKICIICHL